MDLDTRVKVAIYTHTAESGRVPAPGELASRVDLPIEELRPVLARLRERRLLLLEADGLTIRMAPPFSGVPTQHRVRSGGIEYFANCAWDALGVCAALGRPSEVLSRCERSGEPLRLAVAPDGPEPSDWLFHCEVPAARWWNDLVYT